MTPTPITHAAGCTRRIVAYEIRDGFCWSWCPTCGATRVTQPETSR